MSSPVNNGFGELPEDRGDNHTWFGYFSLAVFSLSLLFYRFWYSLGYVTWDDVYLFGVVFFSIMLGRAFRTCLLFTEEVKHLSSRYGNCRWKAFRACLSLPEVQFAGILLVTGVISYKYYTESQNVIMHWQVQVLVVIITALFPRHISKAEISRLNETENKHVADGLAWSYYFGYLKIMLPCLNKMISEAVKPNFSVGEDDIRDLILCRKLLIVIPKDCFCYDSFTSIDNRITFKTSMPEQKRTRGGVQERVYKNTLYQVQLNPDDKPLYVMMEYATPVLSMYDMEKHTKAKFSQEDLESQVKEFSKKLKSILDADPDCKDRYELVLVDNVRERMLADIIFDAVRNVRVSF